MDQLPFMEYWAIKYEYVSGSICKGKW